MKIPDRITAKWIAKRADEELKELFQKFGYGTCHWNMVQKEIAKRERDGSKAFFGL